MESILVKVSELIEKQKFESSNELTAIQKMTQYFGRALTKIMLRSDLNLRNNQKLKKQ